MVQKYKISIPQPCQEYWSKMIPKDNGRFCLNCTKTVVDFTTMLPEEIQHYFVLNANKNICGRFKNTQLDEIIIQIPTRVLYSQTHFHKMFLLALFIAMGTTLFSCKKENGDRQKINKIEVVVSPAHTKNIEKDTVIDTKLKKPSKPHIKIVPHEQYPYMITGDIIPLEIEQDTITKKTDYDAVFDLPSLQTRPYPSQGIDKLNQFIIENYIAPENTKEVFGTIYISFIVEKEGNLSNFKIVREFGTGTGEEVIRILQTSEKWIPGQIDNQYVRSFYVLPISIKATN